MLCQQQSTWHFKLLTWNFHNPGNLGLLELLVNLSLDYPQLCEGPRELPGQYPITLKPDKF